MAYLEIFNDANTVLIDDSYSCFGLATSGTATLGRVDARAENVCGAVDVYHTPPVGATMPIIAIQPQANVPMTVGRMQFANGQYRWRIHCSTYNVNVKYWIFNIPSQMADAGGLFQAWDASGRLVFDSNFKFPRIVDVVNRTMNPDPAQNPAAPNPAWSPIVYPGNRQYAFITTTYCNSFAIFTYERPPGNVWVSGIDWFDYGFWFQGSTLNGSAYRYVGQVSGPLGPPVGKYLSSNAGLMVIDVTNMYF